MPHACVIANVVAVAAGDPGTLLAAMLQGIQSQVRQIGGFRVAVNGKHPTLVVEFIKHEVF
jgi:hypothetical protein